MSDIIERLISRGARPFEFHFETNEADGSRVEFTLEEDEYHGISKFFRGKTLYITGLRLITDTNTAVEYVEIDGSFLIHADSFAGGLGNDAAVSVDGLIENDKQNPTMKDVFGGPVPLRTQIALKSSTSAAGEKVALELRGWMIEQDAEISI